jgi:hypothetical protein
LSVFKLMLITKRTSPRLINCIQLIALIELTTIYCSFIGLVNLAPYWIKTSTATLPMMIRNAIPEIVMRIVV